MRQTIVWSVKCLDDVPRRYEVELTHQKKFCNYFCVKNFFYCVLITFISVSFLNKRVLPYHINESFVPKSNSWSNWVFIRFLTSWFVPVFSLIISSSFCIFSFFVKSCRKLRKVAGRAQLLVAGFQIGTSQKCFPLFLKTHLTH